LYYADTRSATAVLAVLPALKGKEKGGPEAALLESG